MDRAQFYKEVYSITKEIPYGNVFTYGKIAQLIGNPQLEKEGITFKRNGCVNMSKHLWDITGSLTSTIGISPTSATWQ